MNAKEKFKGGTFESIRVAGGLYWDRPLTLVSTCTYVDRSCAKCWARQFYERNLSGTNTMAWGQRISPKWDRLSQNLPGYSPLSKCASRRYAVWYDLFHEQVPLSFIDEAFEFFSKNKKHQFLVLTKRSSRLYTYGRTRRERGLAHPSNVWLGVTVGVQSAVDRMIDLVQYPFSCIKYVSFEPVIEQLDIGDFLHCFETKSLKWAIVGCESGVGRVMPKLAWLESLMQPIVEAQCPVFLKQWDFGHGLEHMPEFNGKFWAEFPAC